MNYVLESRPMKRFGNGFDRWGRWRLSIHAITLPRGGLEELQAKYYYPEFFEMTRDERALAEMEMPDGLQAWSSMPVVSRRRDTASQRRLRAFSKRFRWPPVMELVLCGEAETAQLDARLT